MPHATTRARRAVGAAMAVALAAGVGGVWAAAPASAPTAHAVPGECPDGTLPPPGNTNELWTDNNVSVFVGGDLRAEGSAAEIEGLVVVTGDAAFTRESGRVNVGSVGVGSNVRPSSGDEMLLVGGDLMVGPTTVLDVGALAFDDAGTTLLGGNVEVGGSASPAFPSPRYELNNGGLHAGLGAADALGVFAAWGGAMATQSAAWAAAASTPGAVSGDRVTFTGSGTAGATETFTITASQANAVSEIYFEDIAPDAAVIITVTGSGPVTMLHTYYADDGVRADDLTSPLFGAVAARTLWNLPDAGQVDIAGSSQVLGSLLVPAGSARITASANGRVYVGGDLVVDGVGNELHNYPFVLPPFECEVTPPIPPPDQGSVDVRKMLGDGAGFVPPDARFSGLVSCEVPGRLGLRLEVWTVTPAEPVRIEGLPVGSACTVAELASALPAGFAWRDPVWSVNGTPAGEPVTFVVPPPTGVPQVSLTVTNAVGVSGFVIVTSVSGGGGTDAAASAFSGKWACEVAGSVVAAGSWTTVGEGRAGPFAAPIGATCAVSQAEPPSRAGGWWREPSITPASFVVTDAAASEQIVTVRNVFEQTLPPTGSTPAWWLWVVAIAVLVAGGALAILGWRRNRR